MSHETVKTVRIMPSHVSQGAFVEINESDFDPKKHKLFEKNMTAPIPAPVVVDIPKPAPYISAPEMNATIKAIELALEAGIDLSTIKGTGKNGKITIEDVEAEIEKLTAPESDEK